MSYVGYNMHLNAIDEWSPIHWVCGFILAFMLLKWGFGLIHIVMAILFWEVLEYLWLSKSLFGRLGLNGKEAGINIMSDIIFGFIGALFGYGVYVT